jgi:hypothetical protein
MIDEDVHALLATLDPKTRGDLRRVLIRDQPDRDLICKLYGWPQTDSMTSNLPSRICPAAYMETSRNVEGYQEGKSAGQRMFAAINAGSGIA